MSPAFYSLATGHMKFVGRVVLIEQDDSCDVAFDSMEVIAVILLSDLRGVIDSVDHLILHVANKSSGHPKQHHISKSMRADWLYGHAAFS